jgi:tRNA A-37 threonylcarbamoyl transferase component Bud32
MTTPLNIETSQDLIAYLRASGRISPDETPRLRVLAGGVSNRTVLVQRASGEAWVIKQALAKLRVATDWFSDPARVHREALGTRWLERLAPAGSTTPLVFEDHEHHLFAMQAVPFPHDNLKDLFMSTSLSDAQTVDLASRFGALLGTIHSHALVMEHEVAPAFDDRSFFESLRIEPYYAFAASNVPAAAAFLHELIASTRQRRITLVHGDFSPKNILFRNLSIDPQLVLLDHEVIHWGDPAFDLGFALAHLLSKAHHFPKRRGTFRDGAMAFVTNYFTIAVAEQLNPQAQNRRIIAHTLGCLLARVSGRSTLEYLDTTERHRQRDAVISLLSRPPEHINDLFTLFLSKVGL